MPAILRSQSFSVIYGWAKSFVRLIFWRSFLILVGVTMAVTLRNADAKNVDKVVGTLAIGVFAGLGAALAQAIGSIAANRHCSAVSIRLPPSRFECRLQRSCSSCWRPSDRNW